MKKIIFLLIFAVGIVVSCNRKKTNKIPETRTSGITKILVDESFARILDDQVMVFKSEYHDASVTTIAGNEYKILPKFLNGEVKMIILSRRLKPSEESYYNQMKVPIFTDRFAIDGIALITNADNLDTNITVNEVNDIMRGNSKGNKKLVFDNASSSTVRYFMDSAKVVQLPKAGVYTLQTNNDVIKYVAENKGYIGVVGVNWLLESNKDILSYLPRIKTMGVKNISGKKGSDSYYKPTQNALINGVYPFLRNVYLINAEGRDGLGTGFANWLNSPRGQLIVLKSGLGPHKMISRDFNIKNTN
ncbi:phosphate ABC transporter substrate-binding protein [Pedobacter frigiditerrae]|uniref:Phosphate ABC transporter substrate-binding protein n=1 Tax=Pedobacter frigiditerrae TaxID=2530452 RepID=A0A4R0N2K2_9SPHI|nr:substrate-binding domain-containing protein [Pedobacter frigiditerrae]TCC94068.1 phosphate ABC transporter substrate-binding protein [Pedobacter frigiditerrae]